MLFLRRKTAGIPTTRETRRKQKIENVCSSIMKVKVIPEKAKFELGINML